MIDILLYWNPIEGFVYVRHLSDGSTHIVRK